ncbi:POU domain class 2-associating factor 2 [Anomaloglossus baeobatrachus]|uniref:POU domain class 2-associating factor 2 n=1 Tax=Anomaloglossus baeobatrachus TaxID=238106 RepID=UPI003F4FF797
MIVITEDPAMISYFSGKALELENASTVFALISHFTSPVLIIQSQKWLESVYRSVFSERSNIICCLKSAGEKRKEEKAEQINRNEGYKSCNTGNRALLQAQTWLKVQLHINTGYRCQDYKCICPNPSFCVLCGVFLVPTDFNKRVYQGVRVKHTVKDLLAEKRSRQTPGSRINGGTNASQTPFVQMSSSPVLSGYYGVRGSFLPDSEFHSAKQYSSDLYPSPLGSKSIGCEPTSIQSYPPLLDPYFSDTIGDYRSSSLSSAGSSLFSASSLPPLLPHFSGDPSHYLLRESWEQTVPDNMNQLDVLCADASQTVSSSTSCLPSENGAVHYRSASRGSSSTQGTQSYSLHSLDDVHYPRNFPTTSSYTFPPFMTVSNELTPKMVHHHLSPEDSSETNTLQDNSWPKDDANTVWGPYELRRNY